MRVLLTCYHWSNEIQIEFNLTQQDEEAFGFNLGADPQEASTHISGWFTRESEIHGRRYKVDESKPYIYLYKRMKDGSKVMSSKPINLLEVFQNVNPPSRESLTTSSIDF